MARRRGRPRSRRLLQMQEALRRGKIIKVTLSQYRALNPYLVELEREGYKITVLYRHNDERKCRYISPNELTLLWGSIVDFTKYDESDRLKLL